MTDYVPLDDRAKALLDAKEFATVATVEPTGQPQLSVVWIKRDGDQAVFSTIHGRRKTDNLFRNGQCSILVSPREDPGTYLELRGTVDIIEDPESVLINELSFKYLDVPYTFDEPGARRVIVRLKPYKMIWHTTE